MDRIFAVGQPEIRRGERLSREEVAAEAFGVVELDRSEPVDRASVVLEFAEPGILTFGKLTDLRIELIVHFLHRELPLQKAREITVFETEEFHLLPAHALRVETFRLLHHAVCEAFVETQENTGARFLQGQLTMEEMHDRLYAKICQFAKRQDSWFRKFENDGCPIHWIRPDQIDDAERLCRDFLAGQPLPAPVFRLADCKYPVHPEADSGRNGKKVR